MTSLAIHSHTSGVFIVKLLHLLLFTLTSENSFRPPPVRHEPLLKSPIRVLQTILFTHSPWKAWVPATAGLCLWNPL